MMSARWVLVHDVLNFWAGRKREGEPRDEKNLAATGNAQEYELHSDAILRKEDSFKRVPEREGEMRERIVELRSEFGLRGGVIIRFDFLCQHGF